MDVRHKDLNRSKNRVDNLEWCTRAETISDAFDRGSKTPPRSIRVRVIETGEIFESVSKCSRVLGCNKSDILKCLAGSRPHAKGYHFEVV